MEETINDLYINQQKLINKITNNNQIIKSLNNDIEELLISDKSNKIIMNMKKKEMELNEIIKNQEKIIQDKRNQYNSLL